ncbi:MAG: hypothetical protein AAF702_09390 [Chloroflexota bacterium]
MNHIKGFYRLAVPVLISMTIMSCQMDSDMPISSSGTSSNSVSIEKTHRPQADQQMEAEMNIEGEVIEIMESWPLQLTVETDSSLVHVELTEETIIMAQNETITPANLKIGQRVKVDGEGGNDVMIAQSIEVLMQE